MFDVRCKREDVREKIFVVRCKREDVRCDGCWVMDKGVQICETWSRYRYN